MLWYAGLTCEAIQGILIPAAVIPSMAGSLAAAARAAIAPRLRRHLHRLQGRGPPAVAIASSVLPSPSSRANDNGLTYRVLSIGAASYGDGDSISVNARRLGRPSYS